MQVIKYLMLFFVFILSMLIGRYKAKQYTYRLKELEEIKCNLNILKTKIKFTYEPIPKIFEELANNSSPNIACLFNNSKNKMKNKTASISWEEAIEETNCNLKVEDKQKLKTLSKLLRYNRHGRTIKSNRYNRRIFRRTNKRSTRRKKQK